MLSLPFSVGKALKVRWGLREWRGGFSKTRPGVWDFWKELLSVGLKHKPLPSGGKGLRRGKEEDLRGEMARMMQYSLSAFLGVCS
jgi:hypothetical protein